MHCSSRSLSYAQWLAPLLCELSSTSRLPTKRRSFTSTSKNLTDSSQSGREHDDDSLHSFPASGPDRLPDAGTTASGPASLPSNNLLRSPVEIRKAKSAAEKRQKRKASRPVEPEPLPDPLRHNPWAMALASPTRFCSVSQARIPMDFMIDFGFVKHPTTNALWIMPMSLLDKPSKGTGTAAPEILTSAGNKRPPTLRFANSPAVLDKVSSTRPRDLQKFVPFMFKAPQGPLTDTMQQRLVWREDMTAFVQDHLRKLAVRELKRSALADVNPTVPPPGWYSLETDGDPDVRQLEESLSKLGELENMGWGAVLVLGFPTGKQAESDQSESSQDGNDEDLSSQIPRRDPLPDLIRLPDPLLKVAVFDLRELLSAGQLEELRACHMLFQSTAVFFRATLQMTSRPLRQLWKLKNSIIDDGDLSG